MEDRLDNVEPVENATPAWRPSARLDELLLAGIVAMLGSAALAVAGSILELPQPRVAGWTLAHSLGWGSLMALGLVLRAYLALAQEADSFGLAKSASCLFGTLLLLQALELATMNLLPMWGEIVVWILFGLGLLALLVGPFVSPSEAKPPGAEAAQGPSGTSKAGLLGGLVTAAIVVLKLAGKGLFLKFLALCVIARLWRFQGDLTFILWILLALLGLAFLLWFAVTKLRLRDRLGLSAVFVGWTEILGSMACLAAGAWVIVAALTALEQPGLNEQARDQIYEGIARDLTVISIGAQVLWGGLTIFLFMAIRGRYDPDEEWRQDLETS